MLLTHSDISSITMYIGFLFDILLIASKIAFPLSVQLFSSISSFNPPLNFTFIPVPATEASISSNSSLNRIKVSFKPLTNLLRALVTSKAAVANSITNFSGVSMYIMSKNRHK